MAEVIWTAPALQELDVIAEYIALDNPAAASDVVKAIFDKTERLENFLKSGRTPPELPDSVYRELVFYPVAFFIERKSSGFSSSLSCEKNDSFVRLCLDTANNLRRSGSSLLRCKQVRAHALNVQYFLESICHQ